MHTFYESFVVFPIMTWNMGLQLSPGNSHQRPSSSSSPIFITLYLVVRYSYWGIAGPSAVGEEMHGSCQCYSCLVTHYASIYLPPLVQSMGCRMVGAKPLSKLMLEYFKWTSAKKRQWKFKRSHPRPGDTRWCTPQINKHQESVCCVVLCYVVLCYVTGPYIIICALTYKGIPSSQSISW